MLTIKSKLSPGKRTAFTLITALAFTLIVGTVLAGVGTLSLSSYGRANVEGNYAGAIALADAGVNFEIASISRGLQNPVGGNLASGAAAWTSPHTGTIIDANHSYKVFTEQWTAASGCLANTTWPGIGDNCIVATGTVNGVSRKVQIHGRGESFFNDYSIYATGTGGATFNGLGKSDKDGIQGNMGSNGTVTLHGAIGSDAIAGTLDMNGPNATSPGAGGNVVHNSTAVNFPTVAEVANALFPAGGLTYLQTHNNNAGIMMLKSGDPTLASEPTISGLTLADVTSKMTTAGYTAASRTLSTSPITVTTDTSALDKSGGTRFAENGQGAQGSKVLFFPPGDYYFSDFAPNTTLVILSHLGLVRFWIDSSSTSGDSFQHLTVMITDTTPSTFRIYYNKCAQISMHGNSTFNGTVYAVKAGCSSGNPTVDMSGSNAWYGGLIANTFTVGGGSKVFYPNNGGGNVNDPSAFIGFQDGWKEVPATGGTTFADGTAN